VKRKHYQNLAGQLLNAFEDGDVVAKSRVLAVWGADQTHFGLQRAQHVIAREHGAKSWAELTKGLP
jgi:hypothetical protein